MPTKNSLRAKTLKLLSSQTLKAREKASRRIERKLFSMAAFKRAKCVGFYVSLPSEVNTFGMIDRSLRQGKRVAVPVTNLENKELSLYEIKNSSKDLRKGAYGILEPRPKKKNLISSNEVDCLIVPGVVFDKKHQRLGRGKGYYDRFLKKFGPKTLKIGLVFSFQLVPRIPTQTHDEPVDRVLTD